jgi:hypothetical protein
VTRSGFESWALERLAIEVVGRLNVRSLLSHKMLYYNNTLISCSQAHSSAIFANLRQFKLLKLRYFLRFFGIFRLQGNSIAARVQSTIDVVAAEPVVDPIAITDVEPALGAIAPDGTLDEPREGLWERWVEHPRVDLAGNPLDDVATAARLIARGPIWVVSVEPLQDPRSVQKIVYEGVDHDERRTELGPSFSLAAGRQE